MGIWEPSWTTFLLPIASLMLAQIVCSHDGRHKYSVTLAYSYQVATLIAIVASVNETESMWILAFLKLRLAVSSILREICMRQGASSLGRAKLQGGCHGQ